MENGTGDGDIQPFPNGVFADAAGTLRFSANGNASASTVALEASSNSWISRDRARRKPRVANSLRVSARLEAVIRQRQETRQPLEEAMLTLAGLQRVEYVFVLPPVGEQPGDLILAGPAGDWQVRADGKIVGAATGQPIVRLDDLITLLRRHACDRAKPSAYPSTHVRRT